MQEEFERLAALFWAQIRGIAPARFEAYVESGDSDPLDAVARYLWNVALCEALGPVLHAAEITLKNSIHNSLTRANGDSAWFDIYDFLEQGERQRVINAREDLYKKRKQDTPDRVVGELSFGFWTGLLSIRYERKVAYPVLRYGFQNIPSDKKQRTVISARFNKARDLRNRSSHLESIWNFTGLRKVHEDTLEAVEWINPVFAGTVRAIDRFGQVHRDGIAPYRAEIERKLRAQIEARPLLTDRAETAPKTEQLPAS